MAIGTRYHRIVQVQLAHNGVDFYLRLEFGIHHEENERNHTHLSTFYQFLTRFDLVNFLISRRNFRPFQTSNTSFDMII